MEPILNLINVNSEDDEEQQQFPMVLAYRKFPFRIFGVALPEYSNRYVYFLIYLRNYLDYIGEKCIRFRIKQHKSGSV